MDRRQFSKTAAALGLGTLVNTSFLHGMPEKEEEIMTVKGPMNVRDLGVVLSHEHVLVDFIGAAQTGYHRWDRSEVVRVIKPYLQEIKRCGVQSFFECTPAYIGRDPRILRELSEITGIHFITNTGYYGARDNFFLPQHAFSESAEQLADRWSREWVEGIEDTGIRPGFIKIGVDHGSLSELHEKLVRAAAKAHLKTGLTIASHTGTAQGAFDQFAVLEEEGVSLEAMIWVHAQAEKDLSRHVEAARRGVWVSFDGVGEDSIDAYVGMLNNIKNHQLLSRILISHDAGWYRPGEPDGGQIRGYTVIFDRLIPALRKAGFSGDETDQLIRKNPAQSYLIRKKPLIKG